MSETMLGVSASRAPSFVTFDKFSAGEVPAGSGRNRR